MTLKLNIRLTTSTADIAVWSATFLRHCTRYRFYSFFMIFMVLIMGFSGRDWGPMYHAEASSPDCPHK